MNKASSEFNKQLALDVLVNGLSEVTQDYVNKFDRYAFTEVVIPEGVKSIGDMVFAYCSGLKRITIPDSVTSIGDRAFAYCSGLTSITIPDRVTSIGDFAFFRCYNLKNLTIPKKTNIGFNAFEGCGFVFGGTFHARL